MTEESTQSLVKPGQALYTEDGERVGTVQGFTDHGFEVRIDAGVDRFTLEHDPGHAVGEGYIVWRCDDCGAVGDLDDIPEQCPDCGAPREALYAWLED